ncbi:amidohydrolase [Bordetella bronchiseptica]|uniref:Amidohydrolase 3 domain-containing protein n=2 Tax=Bordetella bronchiseptica TaxID=518 RepID=A0A0C6P9S9_BORBO|nr:amidohydrolase [Bordetella bronchiseptica]SHQ24907.1 amidohydrolase [Mycobacteroides abscessus subsp. abscessus]AWP73384.1 amidohydrolase [Bordetella bronchiseptica]AZW10929.1 amidohydrolase [Bordetella bronchiseptica]AZW20189.1 amidohydrolase [Bordetella bronchiseptica]KDB96719.1 amidohydrolase family protein [Bordetella bronchiseptica D993]
MTLSPTTIFPARCIHTMNATQPRATHVAVREGRILDVGDASLREAWPDAVVDSRFSDKVLLPGLIEGHSHLLEGGMWRFVYVGYYDRRGPDGRVWPGLKSYEAVIERLREAEALMPDAQAPLLAWGFDPIHFGGQRMTTCHLDQVSKTRRIVVLHASVHLLNVNTAMLRQADIHAGLRIDGIVRAADGTPTGELQEFAAMFMVFKHIGNVFFDAGQSEEGIRNFAKIAQQAGVTTATDLSHALADDMVDNLVRVTGEDDFPLRLVAAYSPMRDMNGRSVDRVLGAMQRNTAKLHFGLVKLVIDGSIQGYTARVRWPGYHNGAPNGMWIIAPQQLRELLMEYHKAGLTIHIHTNGDEATEVAMDALESVLAEYPRWDHRHTLQHCQMADAAQFRRMARLGMCANLFANHLYFWGDAHYTDTLGPARAFRMNAAKTALQAGVPISLHSDAPITPIGPLFTAWCAVNRVTAGGRILGSQERIPVMDALHAMTLGAAYTLKLDHLIGSIEVGKLADFAVLEADPLEIAPQDLAGIGIWGTVLGGRSFPAPQLS